MELNVNRALLDTHPSAKNLISLLTENEKKLGLEDAKIYYRFPLYLDGNILKNPDVMIISKKYGVIIFKSLECSERTLNLDILNESKENLEQLHSIIYSKLIKSKILRSGPVKLNIELNTIIYLSDSESNLDEIVPGLFSVKVINNNSSLEEEFNRIKLNTPLENSIFDEIVSIIEGSKNLLINNERVIKNPKVDSRGRILEEIESEIAIFDSEQKGAALMIFDGPQRIRGLAGSGKTIVLTMKAAQIHLDQPDAHILYTYWTKNLYDFIKRLITRFYRGFAEKDPDWSKIHIMHAWGGRNLEGVYFNTCIENNIKPFTLTEVREHGKSAFDYICKNIENEELKSNYDYSIIDEGQDFPPSFYKICRKITKNNRVIWGYDECQNIFNIEIQDTKKTFGTDKLGVPYVDFSDGGQDIVLHRCYRNPRKILVTAFALGLGIYNDKIIQMLENKDHWEDLGFSVITGEYKTGDLMEIVRNKKNSPNLKNELLDDKNKTLNWKIFEKFQDECDFVVENIIRDLEEDLLPEDIVVISLDDEASKSYFREISKNLEKKNINTFNLLTAPSNTTTFKLKDHVTLSTVYRAKGNEAGSVYIIGVDKVFREKDSIIQRNKIFTAITRSKAWVTISGIGTYAKYFENEISKVVDKDFKLIFSMPDKSKLKVFQRDLQSKQEALNKLLRSVEDISKEHNLDRDKLLKEFMQREGIKK